MYLQAGKPDTVGDRKDEVLQWLREEKKSSDRGKENNEFGNLKSFDQEFLN